MTGASLAQNLRQYGLLVRGVTRLTDAEVDDFGIDPGRSEIALVGNIGSSYWPIFSQSSEFLDGLGHPLDRWSRRVAESIAQSFSLCALYPFEGPPYFPFQQWAKRAEGLLQSPLGVMIHPEFGLWHSYRFALLGADLGATKCPPTLASPCSECASKPCLNTCPVDAFDGDSYAVAACASYLRDTPLAECNQRGCLARYACPIAAEMRYLDAQGRFHLRAFVDAQQAD